MWTKSLFCFLLWGRVIIRYIDRHYFFIFTGKHTEERSHYSCCIHQKYDVENFPIPHAIISDSWSTSVELYRWNRYRSVVYTTHNAIVDVDVPICHSPENLHRGKFDLQSSSSYFVYLCFEFLGTEDSMLRISYLVVLVNAFYYTPNLLMPAYSDSESRVCQAFYRMSRRIPPFRCWRDRYMSSGFRGG